MIRFTRVRRSEYFSGISPEWILSVVLFVAAILFVFFWNRTQGTEYTVCPMRLLLGIPCPLCGGTSASFLWMEGDPVASFRRNPLVAVAIPLFALFTVLWIGFGIQMRVTSATPKVTTLILLLLALNWAYILSRS